MYYYFYKITNLINGKFYYGIHQTTAMDDRYLGSGKLINKAIKKYGKENFRKDILMFFQSREDMIEYEKSVVTKELVKNPNCYNLVLGGSYNYEVYKNITQQSRERFRSKEFKRKRAIKIKQYWSDPENRKRHSIASKKVWENKTREDRKLHGKKSQEGRSKPLVGRTGLDNDFFKKRVKPKYDQVKDLVYNIVTTMEFPINNIVRYIKQKYGFSLKVQGVIKYLKNLGMISEYEIVKKRFYYTSKGRIRTNEFRYISIPGQKYISVCLNQEYFDEFKNLFKALSDEDISDSQIKRKDFDYLKNTSRAMLTYFLDIGFLIPDKNQEVNLRNKRPKSQLKKSTKTIYKINKDFSNNLLFYNEENLNEFYKCEYNENERTFSFIRV